MIDKIYQNNFDIDATYFKVDNTFKPDIIINNPIFPLIVDNRQKISPVDNQGNNPACVCYAVCSVAEAYFWKRNGYPCNFDAMQLYRKCKEIDENTNGGTTIKNGLTCALESGIFGKFENTNQKIKEIYNLGKDNSEKTINLVKSIIMKYDFLISGFKITSDYYYSTNTNYIIKKYNSSKNAGNHCMTICGWNKDGFIIQNQWGTSFGAKGFCILSYKAFIDSFVCGAYITNIFDNLG
jgi:C1A family cysteine protease